MPTRLQRAIAVFALGAALGLGACGGDAEEKNDYVGQVNEVTSTLNSGLTEVSTEATALSSPDQAADVFSGFATNLETAATDISEISPPDEVGELHDELVQQVETLASEAANAADEVRAGGPASLPGVAGGFISEATRLSNEIDSTISEINGVLQG